VKAEERALRAALATRKEFMAMERRAGVEIQLSLVVLCEVEHEALKFGAS